MDAVAVTGGHPSEVMQDLQLALSAFDRRCRVVVTSTDTLMIERQYTPWWVVAICVVLFPVGLLALLAAPQSDRATVAVSDNGDGSVTLRMAGTFTKASQRAIDDILAHHADELVNG